jgi:hypothetical protein
LGARSLRALPADLIAGVVASAVFLALVLGLRLDVLPGLALAAVTYLGVRLALPRSAPPTTSALPPAEALKQCSRRVAEIQQLAQRLRVTEHAQAAEQLERIGMLAANVLNVIQIDPRKRESADAYLTGYLTPIHSIVSRYVLLAERDVDSAADALAKTEHETLPRIEDALQRLYEKLHAEDVIDLEVESEMLDFRFDDHAHKLG